jgi:hypothetical protein
MVPVTIGGMMVFGIVFRGVVAASGLDYAELRARFLP